MRRLTTRSRPYICLPCQLKTSNSTIVEVNNLPRSRRQKFSSRLRSLSDESCTENACTSINYIPPSFRNSELEYKGFTRHTNEGEGEKASQEFAGGKSSGKIGQQYNRNWQLNQSSDSHATYRLRRYSTASSTTIELSAAQQDELKVAYALKQRLQAGMRQVTSIKSNGKSGQTGGLPIDEILKTIDQDGSQPLEQKLIERLGNKYAGRSYEEVQEDLATAVMHRNSQQRKVNNDKTMKALIRLGVVDDEQQDSSVLKRVIAEQGSETSNVTGKESSGSSTSKPRPRRSLAAMLTPQPTVPRKVTPKVTTTKSEPKKASFPTKSTRAQSIEAESLKLESMEQPDTEDLPTLSFDLSRVLFNPGIYQLRDPRSRVYNFDPYLEHIMPVSEFNFDALTPYRTSSEDNELLKIARRDGKRYTGSSSSMTSALSQFHFLISQWRELNVENFTRGFDESLRTFTIISRAPAAIFLRYRDGVYAVDADKEYDEPNMLMALGKSMEKLLTLEKDEFEKWRKSNAVAESQPLQSTPDVFHYSRQGKFILRSQLDTWDPRLPGSGYFDLKTRAVAGIRMNIREVETGMGYQIKDRYGTWESYEREYYDMMRSTFLKYSLQARMGHMDGIFVAYHNISRIFGFQYVPIPEMDWVLHGQTDSCLGDQEFKFSVNFMEEIFNKGTEAFPEQSLRIHFETREASVTEPKPYMHIFIEPMTEPEIKGIQDRQKAEQEAFERKMLRGEEPEPEAEAELLAGENPGEELDEAAEVPETGETPSDGRLNAPPAAQQTSLGSNAANVEFLDQVSSTATPQSSQKKAEKELLTLKLTIQNKINNQPVTRPSSITSAAKWSIEYKLETVSKESARRLYTFCKNRRMSALKSVLNRNSNDYFIRTIRQMSERGAAWRQEQDKLDAQREQVVLYGDRLGG